MIQVLVAAVGFDRLREGARSKLIQSKGDEVGGSGVRGADGVIRCVVSLYYLASCAYVIRTSDLVNLTVNN